MTEIALARYARQRAGAIRQGMRDYLKTLALIKEAWDQRDWDTLGYADWQSYVDGEFGADRLGLSPEHRQKAVAELRMAGMSTRAIGTALGVSHQTVQRDLSTGPDGPVQPERIVSLDGRERPASRPQSPAPMPEPEPAVDVAGSGHNHPTEGEADARLDAAEWSAAASEAPTGASGPVGAGDPLPPGIAEQIRQRIAEKVRADSDLDDPEAIAAQQRQLSSENVAKGLVALHFALDSDPLRWLAETWQADAYRERDLPRVRDAFTVSGLRSIAKNLDTLADHLDCTGGSL